MTIKGALLAGLLVLTSGALAARTLVPTAPLPASAVPGSTACQPFPPPSNADLEALGGHGETYPDLLNSLVPAVDYARVFPDSKTIVDMPLKAPPQDVAAAYKALNLPDPLSNPDAFATNATINQTLQSFIDKWLSPPGTELIPPAVNLTSGALPIWITEISDPAARAWAEDLFNSWGSLTRVVDPKVAASPDLYTFIPVPNPFVIPGARFREPYYWDSFWVNKGLIASDLTELAVDVVFNFASLIQRIGHIPNGVRSYYINRSQPPVFSQMVAEAYAATGDAVVLQVALPALLRTYAYWTSPPKAVAVMAPDGSEYQLSRYYAAYDQPRPESYREDADTARQAGFDPAHPTDATRELYLNLASGAESGWDYSTRWLAENSTNLTTVRTTQVIPADLNAFLFQMETNIAAFADALGCQELGTRFSQAASARQEAMMATMWDPEAGQWFDLICNFTGLIPVAGGSTQVTGGEPLYAAAAVSPAAEAQASGTKQEVCEPQHSTVVSASNFVPLWAGVVSPNSSEAQLALEGFMRSGLDQIGGVPATLTTSGQQWDYPNVWPPVHDMMVEAFQAVPGGEDLAAQLAQRYLDTALATYQEVGANVEKFNATMVGRPGGGGEYQVVKGFGWTNGVALSLLRMYGFNPSAAAPVGEPAMAPSASDATG